MNIKIDIDITPEELRRFLGLPDMVGLQEEMMRYVRDKMGQGAEGFDPASFLRETTRGSTKAWQRLMSAAFSRAQEAAEAAYQTSEEDDSDDAEAKAETSSQSKRTSRRKTTSNGRRKQNTNQHD